MEPYVEFLTAMGSGYGYMWLSWCRTVEEKTDRTVRLGM